MTADPSEPASPEFYLDQALAAFERALDLADPDERPDTYGVVLHDMAMVHEWAGRGDEAADLYRRSAASKRKGSPAEDLEFTLSALASCLIDQAEFGEARQAVDEAAELLRRPGMDLGAGQRAGRVYGLGLLYERLGDRGEPGAHRAALETFEWSLSLLDGSTSPDSCATVLRAVGRLQLLLGREREAAASLTGAVRYFELDGDRPGQVSALIDLGRIYQHLAERSTVPAPRAPDPGSGSGVGVDGAVVPTAGDIPDDREDDPHDDRAAVAADGAQTTRDVSTV